MESFYNKTFVKEITIEKKSDDAITFNDLELQKFKLKFYKKDIIDIFIDQLFPLKNKINTITNKRLK